MDICAVGALPPLALPFAFFPFFPFAALPAAFPVGAAALAVGAGALVMVFAIVGEAAFAIEGTFAVAAAEGGIQFMNEGIVGGEAFAAMLPHVPWAELAITPIVLTKLAIVVPSFALVESSIALQLPPEALAKSTKVICAP